MDELRSLESFLKTVEAGSFSAAAGLLGLTPAAVSKHIAKMERNLGTRLFQRTTRSLTLTEAGERLYAESAGPIRDLQRALATLTEKASQPAGTLRVSIAPTFARQYVLPLMPEFLTRYPGLKLDWSLENRKVDLVREGYDAAIGADVETDANVVARNLLTLNMLTVAAPAYLTAHGIPATPAALVEHDCIRLRSATTGRLRDWTYDVDGEVVSVPVDGRLVLSDLDVICDATLAGMGIARLGAHQVLPYLEDGRLVNVLGEFRSAPGAIHVYYTHYRLTPPKVRVFVDFLTQAFRESPWVARLRRFDN